MKGALGTAALALLVLLTGGWVLRSLWIEGVATPAVQARSALAEEEPGAPSEPDLRAEVELPAADADEVRLGDWLSEYYGSEWETMRARLVEKGKDLDRTIPRADLPPPWEEVAEEARELFRRSENEEASSRNLIRRWPEPFDLEAFVAKYLGEDAALAERFRSEPGLFATAEQIAWEHMPELDALAEEYLDRLRWQVELVWQTGDYRRAPLTSVPSGDPPSTDVFFSKGGGYRGWTISYTLLHSRDPEVKRLRDTARPLVLARDRAIRDWLASLK